MFRPSQKVLLLLSIMMLATTILVIKSVCAVDEPPIVSDPAEPPDGGSSNPYLTIIFDPGVDTDGYVSGTQIIRAYYGNLDFTPRTATFYASDSFGEDLLGTDSSKPFSQSWDTTAHYDHSAVTIRVVLEAIKDEAGNPTDSMEKTTSVTVLNSSGGGNIPFLDSSGYEFWLIIIGLTSVLGLKRHRRLKEQTDNV